MQPPVRPRRRRLLQPPDRRLGEKREQLSRLPGLEGAGLEGLDSLRGPHVVQQQEARLGEGGTGPRGGGQGRQRHRDGLGILTLSQELPDLIKFVFL